MIELQQKEMAFVNGGAYDISTFSRNIDSYFFNNYDVETQFYQIYSCITGLAWGHKDISNIDGLTRRKKELIKLESAFTTTIDIIVDLIHSKLA